MLFIGRRWSANNNGQAFMRAGESVLGSLPPCTKPSAGFCRDNELSQLTEGCTKRPRASAGRAAGMHSQEGKGEDAASPSWQRELLDHLVLGCGLSKRKIYLAVRSPESFYMRWGSCIYLKVVLEIEVQAGKEGGESSDLQTVPLLRGKLQKLQFNRCRNSGLVLGVLNCKLKQGK